MTDFPIEPSTRRSGPYTATASQTVFDYGFPVLDADDLGVYRLPNGGTTETRLTRGTDYTVTGVGLEDGGTIVLTAAAAAGDRITIVGERTARRLTDFNEAGAFTAAALNLEFDALAVTDQEQTTRLDRTMRLQQGDPAADMRLPLAAVRAGKVSAFDPVTSAPIVSTMTLAQIEAGATNAAASATAAAASATAASGSASAAAASATAAAASAAAIALPLAIGSGGTGATTAAAARTALGVGAADSPAFAAVRSGDVGTGAASNLSLTTSGGTQARVDHVASANRAVVLAGSNGGNPLVTTTAGALALSGAAGQQTTIEADGFTTINHNAAGTNVLRPNATHASYTGNVLQPWSTKAGATDFDLIEAVTGAGADVEFRVRGDGQATTDGSFTGGGADYAEFFEWADGNPSNEDRVGFPVVLDGAKIRKATNADPASSIIGVVSGNPSVLGDAAWNKWSGKHVRDDFGRYVWEDYEIVSWTTIEQLPVEDDEEPRTREIAHSYAVDALPSGVTVPQGATYSTARRRTLSPDFDPAAPYVPRSERPEWSPIGLLGKLRLRKGQPAGDRWIKLRDVSAAVEEWLVR